MAKAAAKHSEGDLKAFTDCMFFTNGNCKLNDKCRYRHCREAAAQTKNCFKWPKLCRDVNCHYRHPAAPRTVDTKKKAATESPVVNSTPYVPSQATAIPSRKEGIISFFWDIENVPIPKAQKPFDIVQRIREKLIVQSGLREYSFSCYCNSTTISQENQLSLFHANVRIIHVPDRKPGAVDRQIMLELDRFERAHQPPATIVLISGDIDFVGKLSDLRHQAGFHVIVIHNKPAKSELKATVNAHYAWDIFTQPTNEPKINQNVPPDESTPRTYQQHRAARANSPKGEPPSKVASASRKNRPATAKKSSHQCPKCQADFESIQALRQHQEAKDHLYECPICEQSFATLDGQTQHQKDKGHYETAFVCLMCNRSFTKMDSLNQHQQATSHFGYLGPSPTNLNEPLSQPIVPPRIPPPIPRLTAPPPPIRPLMPTAVSIPVATTNQRKNDGIEDAAMFVIQKGIDALVQYYPKLFPAKK